MRVQGERDQGGAEERRKGEYCHLAAAGRRGESLLGSFLKKIFRPRSRWGRQTCCHRRSSRAANEDRQALEKGGGFGCTRQ